LISPNLFPRLAMVDLLRGRRGCQYTHINVWIVGARTNVLLA
jgi:hypothetical protein